MQRRRSAPHTFEQNIAAEKAKLEAQLAALQPGPETDALRKKIRQLDTASHLNEWLSSPSLQSPTGQYEASTGKSYRVQADCFSGTAGGAVRGRDRGR
jgi:hypothetical protein